MPVVCALLFVFRYRVGLTLAACAARVTETGYVLLGIGLILCSVMAAYEKRTFETHTLVGVRPERKRARRVRTRIGYSSDNLAIYDTKALSDSCWFSGRTHPRPHPKSW